MYAHFLEVEKPALKPVPAERFSLFEVGTCTVHPDGYVEVARAYYSVPDRLLGEEVRVYWDERLVRIYHQGQCVGVYTRAPAGTFNSLDEHRPVHKPARQQAYQANLLAKAEHIGPRALSWAKSAIEERDVRAYRLLQGMISLTRKHPKERVEQAAKRTPSSLLLTQTHDIIRDLSEYAKEVKV